MIISTLGPQEAFSNKIVVPSRDNNIIKWAIIYYNIDYKEWSFYYVGETAQDHPHI